MPLGDAVYGARSRETRTIDDANLSLALARAKTPGGFAVPELVRVL